MRDRIRQELKMRFSDAFAHHFPDFKLAEAGSPSSGRTLVWARAVSKDLTQFVLVDPVDSEDQFNVEIAWSDDGKYPWREFGQQHFKAENARARERLARLWFKGQIDPSWDVVRSLTHEERRAARKARSRGDHAEAERIHGLVDVPVSDALPRVSPLVDDVMQKLIEYGMPFFRRVTEHRAMSRAV